MQRLQDWSHRATIVLLVTSLTLIGPGLAGVGSSLPLVAVLVALTVGLWVGRNRLAQLPTVADYDLGRYAPDQWVAPAIGAGIALWFLDVSPEEMQALGGGAGLIGMGNYFLRPLYLYVIFRLRQLVEATRDRHSSDPSQ